jgi:hypothetical protein
MDYPGPDRRVHKVYLTRNTEYHLKDNVCVAVRDRGTRQFRNAHIALSLKMEGGVKIFANGAVVPNIAQPLIGDAMFFNVPMGDGEYRQIVTSRVEQIDRPPKRDVMMYPRTRARV